MNKKMFSPTIYLELYVLLLIMTPFIMLMNYLQQFVGDASKLAFHIGSLQMPYSVTMAILLVLTFVIIFRKAITPKRLLYSFITLVLLAIGQHISDWYFNHKFYDLQHNWHYIAYGIYSFLAYRAFKRKGFPEAKIIIVTFVTAILASSFDEIAQVFLSSRIFDVSDIAKDTYGVCLGMFFLHFVIKNREILNDGLEIRRNRIKDYFSSPLSLLIFCMIFSVVLLQFSSLFTDSSYVLLNIIGTVGISAIIFSLIHLSKKRVFRYLIPVTLLLILIGGSISFIVNKGKGITYAKEGLIVYNGIPIPYFDVFIFENGSMRLVDKMHYFNARDKNRILLESSDIVVIGAGFRNQGGKGFNLPTNTGFIYNAEKRIGTQVIIRNTAEAVEIYNRLLKEGKNVTFVIHTTC
ncbi:MAG: VanZ family protein [Candidatus Cloacimonetes bacterium]|nr:VanZ family protein [Candidatus Cloacimonadota bacterium]